MPQITLSNFLLFFCITAGVASAVYAMLLVREAFSKHEEDSPERKKIMKKAYAYMLLAAICASGRLFISYFVTKS